MNKTTVSRRKMLGSVGALAGLSLLPELASAQPTKGSEKSASFSYCLNTSTIMGQKLGLVEEIKLAAKVGYDGIEVWINGLTKYKEEGGSLKDLKKRTEDLGIRIENAIGFAQWIVDNNDVRTKALDQAEKEMEMLAEVGCHRIAAPPAGATNIGGLDLMKAAERFRALVELGEKTGVVPQLELWGFSKNLYRLSQVLFVAAECGHSSVRILPDIYHLYKGGSDFDAVNLLSGNSVEIFHLNDYTNELSQEEIQDKDRIYPGEGIAPISQVIQHLHRSGGPKVLSLELFNRDYWKQDAEKVAEKGLASMKAVVEKALKN